jgi:hypothetical protein
MHEIRRDVPFDDRPPTDMKRSFKDPLLDPVKCRKVAGYRLMRYACATEVNPSCDWLHATDSVCKDFPPKVKIGVRLVCAGKCMAPALLVVPLVGQPCHFSFVSSGSRFEAIPGTDCVFANGLVARDVSGGPRYEPHRRTLFENRRTGMRRQASCGNDSPTESSGSSPVRSDLVLLSRRTVVESQANRVML